MSESDRLCRRHARRGCSICSKSTSTAADTTATDSLLLQTIYNAATSSYDSGSSSCDTSSSSTSTDC